MFSVFCLSKASVKIKDSNKSNITCGICSGGKSIITLQCKHKCCTKCFHKEKICIQCKKENSRCCY